MIFETPRLILRPWRDADRDAFATIVGDPHRVPEGSPLRPHVLYRLANPQNR